MDGDINTVYGNIDMVKILRSQHTFMRRDQLLLFLRIISLTFNAIGYEKTDFYKLEALKLTGTVSVSHWMAIHGFRRIRTGSGSF